MEFKTINKNVATEIDEKKSRFIAHLYYVENTQEAENYIKETKTKYSDAKHNCYAYVIETGDGGLLVKYNDDGEPSRNCWFSYAQSFIRAKIIQCINNSY